MPQDDTTTLIQDCIDRSEKLSDWESKFIDSIDAQLRATVHLSDKQRQTLEKIWEKVT